MVQEIMMEVVLDFRTERIFWEFSEPFGFQNNILECLEDLLALFCDILVHPGHMANLCTGKHIT